MFFIYDIKNHFNRLLNTVHKYITTLSTGCKYHYLMLHIMWNTNHNKQLHVSFATKFWSFVCAQKISKARWEAIIFALLLFCLYALLWTISFPLQVKKLMTQRYSICPLSSTTETEDTKTDHGPKPVVIKKSEEK